MIRRIFLILLALCVMFSTAACFADETDEDDWDDDDDAVESFDDGYDEEEQKTDFKSVSTYNVHTIEMKDFVYKLTDDGQGAILTSYPGEDEDVTFPSEVGDGIPVIAIDDCMCSDNTIIVNIRSPGSVRTIGNAAFSRCPNLKSIIIEEGLVQIGKCSFGGCPELIDIQLPDSLEIVDDFVFAQCRALEEVRFGTRLKSIGTRAFYACQSLSRITVPGGDGVAFGRDYWMIIRPQVSHSTSVPPLILERIAEGRDVLHPEHWPWASLATGGEICFLMVSYSSSNFGSTWSISSFALAR